ncbi:MAG: hypothetical protein ICV67_08480 [Thermoleophilia bacterium]|nr:hypothetical protein [Thermoleophilia bacterium]
MTFPLFLHVLGAMLLVGTLLAVATAILLDWRLADTAGGLTRLGLRTMVIAVVPAHLLMRIGAQWTEAEADLPGEYAWLDIGYIVADLGGLLVLVSLVLAAIGLRKLRAGGGRGLARAVGVISTIMLAGYVVAVWAMTTKPL